MFYESTLAKSWTFGGLILHDSKSTGQENWLQVSFLTSRIWSSLYQSTAACEIPCIDGSIRKPSRARIFNRTKYPTHLGILFSSLEVDMRYFQEALDWNKQENTKKNRTNIKSGRLEDTKLKFCWSKILPNP